MNYLMMKNLIDRIKSERAEVNMIAIVLIIMIVIILAAIFKEGLKGILDLIFSRIKNDISTFQ